MILFSPRTETIQAAINVIKAANLGFRLVKPYEGEFTRDEKQNQMKSETFVAEVQLAAPFALVSSQSRPVEKRENRSLTLKHEISVYIGVANTHNFASQAVPPILALLEQCAYALVGAKLHPRSSELNLENDGIFLVKTDQYNVYEQKYFQSERATI